MAYTRFFGMRSFENIVRDGRFRTPAGSSWLIGEPVSLDPANRGFLRRATANQAPDAQCGLAIFEHIQMPGLDPALSVSSDMATIPGGRYAQMVHGAGAKVWFKNFAGETTYDGRAIIGGSLLADSVDVSALAIGAGLSPDGNGKYQVTSGAGNVAWLTVEQTNPSTGLVEARFNF